MASQITINSTLYSTVSLQWRHDERDCVSNHRSHECLLEHLLRHRSKKTLKLRGTGICEGKSPVTGRFPHKGPVMRKCFHLMTSPCDQMGNKYTAKLRITNPLRGVSASGRYRFPSQRASNIWKSWHRGMSWYSIYHRSTDVADGCAIWSPSVLMMTSCHGNVSAQLH